LRTAPAQSLNGLSAPLAGDFCFGAPGNNEKPGTRPGGLPISIAELALSPRAALIQRMKWAIGGAAGTRAGRAFNCLSSHRNMAEPE